MRPPLPPGLIVMAGFVNLAHVEQTDVVRLRDDPASVPEAFDAAIDAADRLIKDGAGSGETLVLTLTGLLPEEPVPAVVVHTWTTMSNLGRRQLLVAVSDALMQMMSDFIEAASKPKAPPAPTTPSRAELH